MNSLKCNKILYFYTDEYKNDLEAKIICIMFEIINEMDKEDIIEELNKINLNKCIFIKSLLEYHYEYLSLICDHIAGMTDNYANIEYKNLYLI